LGRPGATEVSALASRDAAARDHALDVSRSWLVQAPAGSGKTSLLIQRFLALLAIVDRPERIVAMTFTRKAAAEMRTRIVDALRATAQAPDETQLPAHEARTHQLARRALANDLAMGWRLLEQPTRLRIMTIDALAASIARQAPLAAGLGALPRFVDDASALYREAARAALAQAPVDDPHWRTFLAWQDNDAEAVTRLLAQMLAERDRWPARMFDEDADALRREVEALLAREARDAIALVADLLPRALADALPGHAQAAIDGFCENDAPPDCLPGLEALCREGALPALDDRRSWCALGDWLLTNAGTFLRQVTKRQGFPAAGSGGERHSRVQRKASFEAWLREAASVEGLAQAWHRVRELPPERFEDDTWSFVVAAMRVLAHVAGALERVFRAHGEADFAEATLRALAALGAPDEPSDVLLAIDYRLSHLLIDEFQDTSNAQLALIARLIEGWTPGDGRTLFTVGDPMQSIYRFREADVAQFLEAQARAHIAGVPVGVVELARNFRSQGEIVGWVNDVFRSVLPAVSDPSRGEAAYRPAYADPARDADLAPTFDLVASRGAEADAVVRRIREAQAAGVDDIAVLVRARSHAQALLPVLRRAGIDYSAVDLEDLHDRLATRDLLALARAIAQPTDRLAWLSMLRAPWCGLTLAELLIVAGTPSRTIAEAIEQATVLDALSPDARMRVARFSRAIAPALAARGSASFTARLKGAWLALGGPAYASSPLDRDGTDRVFALIAEHERGGDLSDFETLVDTASRLFAEAGSAQSSGVQVMTLHRAKGLEFDAVIFPGLDLVAGGVDMPLLRWKVREHDGARTLVIAPMRARVGAKSASDPVYRWLQRLDAAEEAAELGRLLYVGATRARRRLHLLALAPPQNAQAGHGLQRPRRGSALERLWDGVSSQLTHHAADEQSDRTAETRGFLERLPIDWQPPTLPNPLPVSPQTASIDARPTFDWAEATAAAIGTVAHRLLAQVGAEGLDAWDAKRVRDARSRIIAELRGEGIERDRVGEAADRVMMILTRTLGDPRGRWLFDRAHEDARSEWSLAGLDQGRVMHIVPDRSFVADGHRYIVDFKTGGHLGADPATFLAREFERYLPQLSRYARIVAAIDRRPIRIALYHPLVDRGWQEHAWPIG